MYRDHDDHDDDDDYKCYILIIMMMIMIMMIIMIYHYYHDDDDNDDEVCQSTVPCVSDAAPRGYTCMQVFAYLAFSDAYAFGYCADSLRLFMFV